MRMSIKGYARARGVTGKAILDAITAGHIRRLPEGGIDSDQADLGWHAPHQARLYGRRDSLERDRRMLTSKIAAGVARTQLARHRYMAMETKTVEQAEVLAAFRQDVGLGVAAFMAEATPEDVALLVEESKASVEHACELLRRFVVQVVAEFGDAEREAVAALERA